MTINEHLSNFAGKPVAQWEPGEPIEDPEGTIYRIATEYDDEKQWEEKLEAFIADPNSSKVVGLIVGAWNEVGIDNGSEPIVEALIKAKEKLPQVKAIFLGDIVMEEAEISWIEQSNVTELLDEYPELEYFGVRGGSELSIPGLKHDKLKTLIIETGGMDKSIVEQISEAKLPALEHLELWLGTDDYGADATIEDLAPILGGDLFPKLKYLGLRNSYIADDIAKALVDAPVLQQIETLDLSLGTLGDEGAEALAGSQAVKKLKKLDIHHHYCSPAVVKKLQALGLELDATEPQEPDDWGDDELHRYVSVGE